MTRNPERLKKERLNLGRSAQAWTNIFDKLKVTCELTFCDGQPSESDWAMWMRLASVDSNLSPRGTRESVCTGSISRQGEAFLQI